MNSIERNPFTLEITRDRLIVAHNANVCMQFKINLKASSRGMIRLGEEGPETLTTKTIQRITDIIKKGNSRRIYCSITGYIDFQKNEIIFSEMRIS